MATIKKKDLKKYEPTKSKKELDELVDGDGSEIEGDKADVNNTEIETAPQQTSDEFAASAIQPNRRYYGIGGAYSSGTMVRGEGVEDIEELDETAKDNMKKIIEDILSKRGNNSGIVDKTDPDINQNKIPDLEDLSSKYQKPIAAKRAQEMLNTISKNNLNGEEIGIILNYLLSNIDITQIPNEYKRAIKRNM
jgi:hypothetical protein